MGRLLFLFISIFLSLPTVARSYPTDKLEKIETQIEEIKKNMVTREEFKLFVEMVNKRFEDMNKRFEDLQTFFSISIGILGLIQGVLILIITLFGSRILRRLGVVSVMETTRRD